MKLVSVLLVAVALVLALLPVHSQTNEAKKPTHVSLLHLIVTPERFDGKLVSVTGFLTLGRENDYLYFSENDATHILLQNAIGVDRNEEIGRNEDPLKGRYVQIEGVFRKGKHLHEEGYLTDIRSCVVWSDPKNPIRDKIKRIPGMRQNDR